METLTLLRTSSKEDAHRILELAKKEGIKFTVEKKTKTKLSKKQALLKDIETGLRQVKAYNEGKGKMYTLSEVLNDK